MIRKRLRRLRGDRGYTLVELLVVLAIFTTVVTALVSLFTSGAKAELDMNRRFEAQQNARLALDRMRRELHCASGITATPNAAVSSDHRHAAVAVSVVPVGPRSRSSTTRASSRPTGTAYGAPRTARPS